EPGRDGVPAALAEAGLGTGRVGRVISDLGRVARGEDGRRVVRLEHRVTRVRLERPPRGTCLVALRATAAASAEPGEQLEVTIGREGGASGGVSAVFVVPERARLSAAG
ncbi:MAG: hypothetical protein AB7R55_11030, partial [Gemmatimonadales bacterium]